MSENPIGHPPADDGASVPVAYDDAPVAHDALLDEEVLVEHGMAARFGVELLGSFVVVLFGVGASLWATVADFGALEVALAFGLALFVALVAFGRISGGHFNPVVTLGAAVAGRAAWSTVLPYWLAQIVGGALATSVLFVVLNDNAQLDQDVVQQIFRGASNSFGELAPGQFGMLGVLVLELVVAGVFVAIVLGATSRGARTGLAAPVIGLGYALGLLVLIPVTNGSMNPARSIASALFAGPEVLGQLWLFAVAPLLGAAIAGMLYALLRPLDDDPLVEEYLAEETAAAEEIEIVEEETDPGTGDPDGSSLR